MKVNFEEIRPEHRTLLLIPCCSCSFCHLLRQKWRLLRALGDDRLKLENQIMVMNLLIGIYTDRYERQEEIAHQSESTRLFYCEGMMNPSSRVSQLQREYMGEQNDFVNRAFSLPTIETMSRREMSQTLRCWKRPVIKSSAKKRSEFQRNLIHLQNEVTLNERRLNDNLKNSIRPFHNCFVSFHSIKSHHQLKSIHDVQAFVNSDLFSNKPNMNRRMKELLSRITELYDSILPKCKETVLYRGTIWDSLETLFLNYFCRECHRFSEKGLVHNRIYKCLLCLQQKQRKNCK